MTGATEQALAELVVDQLVLLEVGADTGGIRPDECADALERLYNVLDELPENGRLLVLRMIDRLVDEEREGPNRGDRLAALRGIGEVLGAG